MGTCAKKITTEDIPEKIVLNYLDYILLEE